MFLLEIVTIFSSALKISFLAEFQQWPIHKDQLELLKLFALNGLPVIIFWFLIRQLVRPDICLLVIMLFVDTLILAAYGKIHLLGEPLNFVDIFELSNAIGVQGSVRHGLPSLAFLQFLDLVIPCYIFARSIRNGNSVGLFCSVRTLRALIRPIIIIILLFLTGLAYFSLYSRQLPASQQPPFPKGFEPWVPEVQKYYKMGPFNYFVTTGIQALFESRRRKVMAPARHEVDRATTLSEQKIDLSVSRDIKVNNKFNVIVILLEAMSKSALDAPIVKDSRESVVPFIASMKNELFYSTNIFSPRLGGATCECEFTVLNSLNPPSHKYGYAYSKFMDHEYRSLPKLLKEHGYATAIFHAGERDYWHRIGAYKAMGIDRYDSREHYKPGTVVGLGLSDDDFFQQTALKLRQLPQPFFAMLITLSGHHPFNLPSDLTSGVTDGLKGLSPLSKKYLENMNYVDRSLKSFWNAISDLRENTIIVILGDHNPALPDADDWESLGYSKRSNRDPSFLAGKQVPLVISAPFLSGQVKSVKDVTGDEADIAPTLLYLLGISIPKYFVGDSLFSTNLKATQFTDNIYYDKFNRYDANSRTCYRNNDNFQISISYCSKLIDEYIYSNVISNDIIWGRRYSYE